jgi:hypothetical protein
MICKERRAVRFQLRNLPSSKAANRTLSLEGRRRSEPVKERMLQRTQGKEPDASLAKVRTTRS